jgi:hypothetical protein
MCGCCVLHIANIWLNTRPPFKLDYTYYHRKLILVVLSIKISGLSTLNYESFLVYFWVPFPTGWYLVYFPCKKMIAMTPQIPYNVVKGIWMNNCNSYVLTVAISNNRI